MKLIRELFGMEAKQDEPDQTHPADEPRKEKEAEPTGLCPCCLAGRMLVERHVPRPTVHEIMHMSIHDLR